MGTIIQHHARALRAHYRVSGAVSNLLIGRILRDLDAVVCHETSTSNICLATVPPGRERPGAPTCIVLDRALPPERERWLLSRAIGYILLDNSCAHIGAGFGESLDDELDDLSRDFAGWLLLDRTDSVDRAAELARAAGIPTAPVRRFLLRVQGSQVFAAPRHPAIPIELTGLA